MAEVELQNENFLSPRREFIYSLSIPCMFMHVEFNSQERLRVVVFFEVPCDALWLEAIHGYWIIFFHIARQT